MSVSQTTTGSIKYVVIIICMCSAKKNKLNEVLAENVFVHHIYNINSSLNSYRNKIDFSTAVHTHPDTTFVYCCGHQLTNCDSKGFSFKLCLVLYLQL